MPRQHRRHGQPASSTTTPVGWYSTSAQSTPASALQAPVRPTRDPAPAHRQPPRSSRQQSVPNAKGPSPEGDGPFVRENQSGTPCRLDAERRAAAAGRLHLGIVKLEAGCFQRLDVVHRAAIQVHQRSRIHKTFKSSKVNTLSIMPLWFSKAMNTGSPSSRRRPRRCAVRREADPGSP